MFNRSLRIIPRSAPFVIQLMGAIGLLIVIALVAWWYYGKQAALVDEIFREASSSVEVPAPAQRLAQVALSPAIRLSE